MLLMVGVRPLASIVYHLCTCRQIPSVTDSLYQLIQCWLLQMAADQTPGRFPFPTMFPIGASTSHS